LAGSEDTTLLHDCVKDAQQVEIERVERSGHLGSGFNSIN
jgi:hypothetical protein